MLDTGNLRFEDRLDYLLMGKEVVSLLEVIRQTQGKDCSHSDSPLKRSDSVTMDSGKVFELSTLCLDLSIHSF